MKKIISILIFIFLIAETYPQIGMNASGNVGLGSSPDGYNKLTVSKTVKITNDSYAGLNIDLGGYYDLVLFPSLNNYCKIGKSDKAFKDIYAYTFHDLNSDSTQKENIRDLEDALDIILNLRGIRFDLKKPVAYNDTITKNPRMIEELEKERKNKIGFIGQEMIHVLPEAVYVDDSTGIYTIDYTRVIPVLVNAMQQQQAIIDKLNNEMESLKSVMLVKSMEVPAGTEEINETGKPYLGQNVPNPFNVSTTINFYIPKSNQKAAIYIYDLQGLQKKAYNISTKGNSSIVINGSELWPGMYLYTLIADGKEVDTKRMILTD